MEWLPYTTLPTEVIALQIPDVLPDELPEPLQSWMFITMTDDSSSRQYFQGTTRGTVMANPGDWVVMDEQQTFYIYTKEEFHTLFVEG